MSGRRPIILAVLITALILVTGGGVAAWALWPEGAATSTQAAPSATLVPAPTPTEAFIDGNARMMCSHLDHARVLGESTEPPAPGWGGSVDEMNAFTARMKAETNAIKSQVPEIKAILETDTDSEGLHTTALAAWCQQNGLDG